MFSDDDDDADMELKYLRREMDRTYSDRLMKLEQHTEELEQKVRDELQSINMTLQHLVSCQKYQEPTIKSLTYLLSAGLVMRWAVILVVGTLAAIGTAATALEAVRSWIGK